MFLFDVNITLTEAGLAAGPGLGLGPIGLLFEFLAMLREAGPQRCEQRASGTVNSRWQLTSLAPGNAAPPGVIATSPSASADVASQARKHMTAPQHRALAQKTC